MTTEATTSQENTTTDDATIDGTVNENENLRQGTISSARFNLLSSMVGGGSLSLPLAFHQSGSTFIAPLILVSTAALAQRSILFLIRAGIYSTTGSVVGAQLEGGDGVAIIGGNNILGNTQNRSNKKGTASYENVASQAFGPSAKYLSTALVFACCFFGTVGYAVLLRDMLEPLVDSLVEPPEGVGGGPTAARNFSMWVVVLCVTPLCTLRNLTALKNVGAASMASVGTVGLCVAYRSLQCHFGSGYGNEKHDAAAGDTMAAFPESMKQLLDAAPLFISAYICHFNVLPIHNELRCPTSDRVKKWVSTSLWPATLFYWVIGFTGSLYAKCTPTGSVQGNILLDFDEDDPLLLLGRFCLAMTITFAFPMLVVPARDILVRSMIDSRAGNRFLRIVSNFHGRLRFRSNSSNVQNHIPTGVINDQIESMEITQGNLDEPLLVLENRSMASTTQDAYPDDVEETMSLASILHDNASRTPQIFDEKTEKLARVTSALFVFWLSVSIACTVESIDVVWDLLGSSFSIMMAFLIPCGAYLQLGKKKRFDEIRDSGLGFRRWMFSRAVAWIMLFLFIPLMFISTTNAVYNSFFSKNG
mmetsp:Transcript_28497/g.57137  ORF Transcript_28497/g.57137 Transcript_28497/m.57137 type:complete len:589 (+) Transcript_28497:128-1894(+)